MLIGYARCSTDDQDLTAQRAELERLGVDPDAIYIDQGLTGKNRDRPGLDQALAAVRAGDTLVVTKLDRLGRSVPDLRSIAAELETKGATLSIGSATYDPNDPFGKLFFNLLAMIAEFEGDIISQRTREGMATAKAKGRLKGRQPILGNAARAEVRRMMAAGDHSAAEVAEIFGISRATVYRYADGSG